MERKTAWFRKHLRFTLHCKHGDTVPTRLRIKTSMLGPRADKSPKHRKPYWTIGSLRSTSIWNNYRTNGKKTDSCLHQSSNNYFWAYEYVRKGCLSENECSKQRQKFVRLERKKTTVDSTTHESDEESRALQSGSSINPTEHCRMTRLHY